ncbi:hypothetical protein GCM10027567_26410 [Spongiibacter taiwanensis]
MTKIYVQFKDSAGSVSPAVCLESDAESIKQKIAECSTYMSTTPDSLACSFPRFLGMCHEILAGQTDMMLWNQKSVINPNDDGSPDCEMFIVNCSNWIVRDAVRNQVFPADEWGQEQT